MEKLKPMSYDKFKLLTDAEKKDYISKVNREFHASRGMVAFMLGISADRVTAIAESIGFRFPPFRNNMFTILRFGKWLGTCNSPPLPELTQTSEVIVEQEAPAFRFHPAVPVMIPDDSTAVAITFPGGVTCTITGKGAAHE